MSPITVIIDGATTAIHPHKPAVANFAALPIAGNIDGDTRTVLDEDALYLWDEEQAGPNKWVFLSGASSLINHASMHVGGGTDPIDTATALVHGLMSSTDFSKLGGIQAGAQVNPVDTDALPEGTSNLYYTEIRVSANTDVAANTSSRHTQNSDTSLDLGNPDEVTAADLRAHLDNLIKHRIINDAGVSVTELWSANKINAEFSAISSGYSRRRKVISIVDNTLIPPTEVLGDRYILDFTAGAVHANWDGALVGDIVEFNGTTWDSTSPIEGWIAYSDLDNKDALYVDDGVPTWTLRPAIITDHGILAGLADDDHAQYHNDARALTWLGTRSTTDLSEGTNLYHTTLRVQDIIDAYVTTKVQNIVRVRSGVTAITGVIYPTIAAALVYVNAQTPSSTNRWEIEVEDVINNETFTVPTYTTIRCTGGIEKARLTGTITLSGVLSTIENAEINGATITCSAAPSIFRFVDFEGVALTVSSGNVALISFCMTDQLGVSSTYTVDGVLYITHGEHLIPDTNFIVNSGGIAKFISTKINGCKNSGITEVFNSTIIDYTLEAIGSATVYSSLFKNFTNNGGTLNNHGHLYDNSNTSLISINSQSAIDELANRLPDVADKTAAYTLVDADDVIKVDAFGGAIPITLPTAVGRKGKIFTIKRINGGINDVTVGTTGGELIDNISSYVLSGRWASVSVISTGVHWVIIYAYNPAAVITGNRKIITTTPYTVLSTDNMLSVDTSASAMVENLPSASIVGEGKAIIIKDYKGNANTNNITINADGTDTIDQNTSITINADGDSVTLVSDGVSNWEVI